MGRLYPTVMCLIGIKFGVQRVGLMTIDGEFSYIMAALVGCVVFSSLVLCDWAISSIGLAFKSFKLKLNRNRMGGKK